MVNCITLNSTSRVALASRNAFNMVANLSRMQWLLGTKEPSLKVLCRKSGTRISWSYWFKKVLYYQVALAYVLTRLIVNVSQVSRLYLFLFSPHIFG
ncbi:hypothetical protein IC575_004481 [Cucumis melo]